MGKSGARHAVVEEDQLRTASKKPYKTPGKLGGTKGMGLQLAIVNRGG